MLNWELLLSLPRRILVWDNGWYLFFSNKSPDKYRSTGSADNAYRFTKIQTAATNHNWLGQIWIWMRAFLLRTTPDWFIHSKSNSWLSSFLNGNHTLCLIYQFPVYRRPPSGRKVGVQFISLHFKRTISKITNVLALGTVRSKYNCVTFYCWSAGQIR